MGSIQDAAMHHEFQTQSSRHLRSQLEEIEAKEGPIGVNVNPLFAGIAGLKEANGDIQVSIAIRDDTYGVDFCTRHFDQDELSKSASDPQSYVADYILSGLNKYEHDHRCKIIGAGLENGFVETLCPDVCSALWANMDILPMVFRPDTEVPAAGECQIAHTVDEHADSMARKCIMSYGPNQQPRLEIGYRNKVEVDAGGHTQMTQLSDYKSTVGARTWDATMKYAEQLKGRNVKIAFFSATPQGGGVALMRHALIRFLKLLNIDASWYVPQSRPEVFRITKTNHNILQGVAREGERLSEKQQEIITEWINQNAERYWLSPGGPLAPRSAGGAHVIFVDDPQVPGVIPMAKKADPDRQVLFRSHIQIRSDLVATHGSPAAEVWRYLWKSGIGQADLFISHPVREFIPPDVPPPRVGYMPAATDWLDGLNKDLRSWNTRYYIHNFNLDCERMRVNKLDYPKRDYIIQIARFDPSKGIPDVVESYSILRREKGLDISGLAVPQLLITGISSIDDPDGTTIYDQTMELLEKKYADIASDVVVMRVGPIDQLLDALISQAKVVLQLSTREGFEVKVSEAIHKGVPVIATKAGGIPLQVQHGKSGFLVETGDNAAVAQHMHDLLTNTELYDRMSNYAKKAVSDEVSTVGNALSWLYLADRMSRGEKLEPHGQWINDRAREEAGFLYEKGENRLPRPESLAL